LSGPVSSDQFRDRDRICCHDISVTQCYAIDALLRRGPSTLNDLAGELYLDKSTASRVVTTLVRKSYVTRTPHPDDGRAVVLAVTPAGRRLHDRIARDLVEEETRLLEEFEPEVRRGAARLIFRLARAAAARARRRRGPRLRTCRESPGMPLVTRALPLGLLAWLGAGAAGTEDWTQWRGPSRDAVVADLGFLEDWPARLVPRWRVEVGEGPSTPVVSGTTVFVFSREGDEGGRPGSGPRDGRGGAFPSSRRAARTSSLPCSPGRPS